MGRVEERSVIRASEIKRQSGYCGKLKQRWDRVRGEIRGGVE